MRPTIGRMQLLVYRECAEGCWCATGESERPPRCAEHGLAMVTAPADPREARDPKTGGYKDPTAYRRLGIRRLGFAALFGYEQGLVKIVHEDVQRRGLRPYTDAGWTVGSYDMVERGPYFDPDEIRAYSEVVE